MADIKGTRGNDDLDGTADADRIAGGRGRDDLRGSNGDDLLVGGANDDTLRGDDGGSRGRLGVDTLRGGEGEDTFRWGVGSNESIFSAPDRVEDFEGASVVGGDALELDAGSGADRRFVFEGRFEARPEIGAELGFGGNGLTEVFYAIDGDTTAVFADSDDDGVLDADDFSVRLTLGDARDLTEDDFISGNFATLGTAADDTLRGTADDDRIFGLAGADQIRGGRGFDRLNGGAGDDLLDLSQSRSGGEAFGGGGDDSVIGSGGDDLVSGSAGDDTIVGGDGVDDLRGGAGDDRLVGGPGSGADTLLGGAGDDVVDLTDASFGGDAIGGAGDDTLIGSDVSISFSFLDGDAGRDVLTAGANGAILRGGTGRDRLIGGADADIMTGGDPTQPIENGFDGARDVYVFGAVWGGDLINGFEDDIDKIDLSATRPGRLTFESLTIGEDTRGQTFVRYSNEVGTIRVNGVDAENLTESDFIL